MKHLDYDVMICTLNRPESLERAFSSIERQTLTPRRVIIVDASDNHDEIKRRVLSGRDRTIDWRMEFSPVKSTTYQRNMGIAFVESPIVLAPDDDSVLYPNAAASMVAAYEKDGDGAVAAVSGTAALRPPDAVSVGNKTAGRTIKDMIEPTRNRIERKIFPKPFDEFPKSLWSLRDVPEWITGKYALVGTVGGFLLSLRTSIIQRVKFDDTMGYGMGYALHEDMELSLRIQRLGYLLVGAHDAPIYHDVHPGRRAGGFNYGFCWIANYIYACRRNIPEASPIWRRDLPRFIDYKIALYRARAIAQRSSYAREVLRGAVTARSASVRVAGATVDDAPSAYRELCDEFLRR